jgi:hypothetical protein
MENLDLNISNYSIKDIENFFHLNSSSYTLVDINSKEQGLKDKLFKSNVNETLKNQLINFIYKAKQILMINISTNNNLNDNDNNYDNIINHEIINNKLVKSKIDEKNIITHPQTQFIYSNPSEYFPGKINPLNTRITHTSIIIDSRFRDNYTTTTSSDFTIYLPTRLTKVVSMQVSSIEIPICFYGISSTYGNNYFSITIYYVEYGIEKNSTKEIIVPDGNYTPTVFITLLNNLISPKNQDGSILFPEDIFSYIIITVDLANDTSGTGKVTFDVTGEKASSILSFTIDFSRSLKVTDCFDNNNPLTSRIGYNLGFIKEIYKNATSYTSETVIEPATIRYFYLSIDDYNNNVNSYFIPAYKNGTTFTSSIIAKISIKGTYFSYIMENEYNICTEPRKYFGPVDIQKLRVTLLDDHGRILEMSGNYSFCLLFEQLYDL